MVQVMADIIQRWHPWHLWEDHRHGFYNNISGKKKRQIAEAVVALFKDTPRLACAMRAVAETWTYAMEHNLTNPSLNKIAYIGQCAACLEVGAPATVTMEMWSTLDASVRKAADAAALAVLKDWEKTTNNQLCLNFI